MTIPRSTDTLEVVDGQQRLATTAILLAAIRDHLSTRDAIIAESINTEILTGIDRAGRARVPRLRLNLDDNEYFRARLVGGDPIPQPTKPSHRLIEDAFTEARAQVQRIVAGFDDKDHGDILNNWLTFMEFRALAVLLRVPNDADGYRMFETLNDRGLRTSQSDLVKNYLFGRSGDRIQETQQKWAAMRGALETIEDDDLTIMFLRHALTVMHGFVRENQVYDSVQNIVKAEHPAISFSSQIESLSNTYVSIHNAEHERWNRFSTTTRRAIEVLNLFGIKPMRPLMLAIAHKMVDREAEKAFQFCVSLSVRLMIAGSTRTGTVEEGLAEAAHKVFIEEVKTASELKETLKSIIPTDETFSNAFETSTVSNAKLARYYLRSLELAAKSQNEPWHIPNDDQNIINLEHILPLRPEGNWPQFSEEQAKLYAKRLGNLCLMRASDNSAARSAAFSEKRSMFQCADAYVLTKQIGEADEWNPTTISERQKILAAYAVKTWPIQ